MPAQTTIRLQNITKYFGNYPVLNNISTEFKPGRVYCILGENGAGKSTMAKMLAGVTPADSGNLFINNSPSSRFSPSRASASGIRLACQENSLFENLTVAENIMINNEATYNGSNILKERSNYHKSRALLDGLGIKISEKAYVKDLSLPECKQIEIAKSFLGEPSVIILDEPTAPLGIPETENLIEAIFKARRRGACIIYITHIIEEVSRIADQVIVMNGGAIVVDKEYSELDSSDFFLRSMAGEDYLNRYPKTRAKKGKTLLQASNLSSSNNAVRNISFSLKSGEILGIAGLQGAGKSTIAKMLFGLENIKAGTIRVGDEEIKIQRPSHAIKKDIAYLGDETLRGIFPSLSLIENIMLMSYKRYIKNGFLNNKKIAIEARESMHYFRMNVNNPDKKISKQSIGTIQKSNICRWALMDSKVYIMDDPTQSLDIPSKLEIYNLMNKLTHSDSAILFISSDISELVGMCDRILILFNGEIIKEIDSEKISCKDILNYSFGNV